MEKNSINKSIECVVDNCRFHSGRDNYCTLSKIKIGKEIEHPTDHQYTDCRSFETHS